MNTFTPRQVAICLAVFLVFLIPYTLGWAWGWWKFVGTSALIVILWRWARPHGFEADGIQGRRTDFALAISSLLVVGIGASLLIPAILLRHGYRPLQTSPAWRFLAVPFQTLNEETVLRALLLTVLARFMKVRLLVSIVSATLQAQTGIDFPADHPPGAFVHGQSASIFTQKSGLPIVLLHD